MGEKAGTAVSELRPGSPKVISPNFLDAALRFNLYLKLFNLIPPFARMHCGIVELRRGLGSSTGRQPRRVVAL